MKDINTGCNYCSKEGDANLINVSDWNSLDRIVHIFKKEMVLEYYFFDMYGENISIKDSVPIKFCPMCGRNLEEREI